MFFFVRRSCCSDFIVSIRETKIEVIRFSAVTRGSCACRAFVLAHARSLIQALCSAAAADNNNNKKKKNNNVDQ